MTFQSLHHGGKSSPSPMMTLSVKPVSHIATQSNAISYVLHMKWVLHGCLRAGNEDDWEAEADRAEEHKEPSEAVWAAFWGWDCCGPAGVLDRLYSALKIPERSWSVHAPALLRACVQ